MNYPKISVVIVTFNSLRLIKDCIDSIFTYNDLQRDEIEIIVVDNSSDEIGAELKKFLNEQYPNEILFIKNNNLGYGQGNNVGIRAATGQIIAVMNPDVRLVEPLFKKTLQNFEDPDVATVGFVQKNGKVDNSLFFSPQFFLPFFSSLEAKIFNKLKYFNSKKYYLSGAFIFFRKRDFETIGLYDESIYMYFEEPDVALRFNNIGKKTVFDHSRSYIHLMDVKDDYNVRLLDIGTESIKLYFTKHHFNLERYVKLRIWELRMHKKIFGFTGKRARIEKAEAYITSLSKLL